MTEACRDDSASNVTTTLDRLLLDAGLDPDALDGPELGSHL
jgi:hypothetical protein